MVIEQYTIADKYNFPQPSIDTILPQRLLEQSLNSLKQVQHQPLGRSPQYLQRINGSDECQSNIQLKPRPISIKPDPQETLIAAADTSTIKIGETRTGMIIAIRGATTWKQHGSYEYTRLGPFIFHITEENKSQLFNSLEHAYFSNTCSTNHQSSPNMMQMPLRIASLFERWMQTMIAKTIKNGVLLFDGSLTSGTVDTPTQRLKEILSYARRNGDIVLAFSKATTLRSNGFLITDQLPNEEPPFLIETTGIHSKPPIILLGEVYVARLNKGNLAFRLDIDRETSFEQRMNALRKLIGNDLYSQSYPETLRLSHILCTFTANEVIAIKHFITSKYGIQIVNRPDIHKLLFGAFGKGEI